MTDRELLEAAARAAGIRWSKAYKSYVVDDELCPGIASREWRPLRDGRDALALAVSLGMSIEVHHDQSQPLPWLRVVYGQDKRWVHVGPEEYAVSPLAATRRAIVRAAAALAGSKQE